MLGNTPLPQIQKWQSLVLYHAFIEITTYSKLMYRLSSSSTDKLRYETNHKFNH